MILIYGKCNKIASAVARLYRQETFSQKLFVFSQFHLNQKINIHVNFRNVV
jgi:hypothetical protein